LVDASTSLEVASASPRPHSAPDPARTAAAVDFRDGLIVREVDYWDGRHFGIDAVNALRTPDAQFPTTYGEEFIAERSSPALRRVLDRLRAALAVGDTTGLFAEDATFESRFTVTWDGSRVDAAAMATLLADTLEH
jgi:hypothetical protein